MKIEEVRLKLTQQALDRGMHPDFIPRVIEPLVQYICKGIYLKDLPPKQAWVKNV